MKESFLDDDYWSERYAHANTGWDVGNASLPLKEYIDQLNNKKIRILIPGCGNAYEASYLLKNGFSNITLIDIASNLVASLQQQFIDTGVKVLHGNFFDHQETYDLILEQTFFCAIHPGLRSAYVNKMHALLDVKGKLAGVLFNRAFVGGPPFGGNIELYSQLFQPLFQCKVLAPCYNSIPPRMGTEAFMIMEKNSTVS